MALPKFYATGTATVAAGGTAVTGTGTAWSGNVVTGDYFRAQGLVERIASVNSNTSLTLAAPWPGAALNASAYEIEFTPDAVELAGATRELRLLLEDGVLQALAAAGSGANKLAWYDGAGSAALADFSEFARTLLDDEDAAAMRGTLLAMAAGEGAIGTSSAPAAPNADLNNVPVTGVNSADAGATNLPPWATNWLVFTMFRTSSIKVQMALSRISANEMAIRMDPGTGWTAWRRVWHDGNLGTRIYSVTTAVSPNVSVGSDGVLARSTSSRRYKCDIHDLAETDRDAVLQLRPVRYRSACEGDRDDWSYYGLIAEEVAEIDPRLVHWRTTETVVIDEGLPSERQEERLLDTPIAEGVMYDRIVPHLVGLMKRQDSQIADLKARMDVLEAS